MILTIRSLDFSLSREGYYDEQAGKKLNSHTRTTLMQYRRMLVLYNSLTDNGDELGLSGLKQIAAI